MRRKAIMIPHIAWRNGRPRFEPGPALRRMGYKGRDLKAPNGDWLSLAEALAISGQITAEVAARRDAKARTGRMAPKPKASAADAPRLMTVEALLDTWFAHGSMRPGSTGRTGQRVKAAATVASYRKFAKVLAADAPDIHGAFVAALDRVITFNLYERLCERRGLATAAGVIRTLSAAISFGMKRGHVPAMLHPCEKLGMQAAPPRLRVAERHEIAALVAAADALDRPEIGDAILLGVWTGQRQKDRMELVDEGLLNGRRYFRQSKTGAVCAIREAPILTARLQAARERRAGHRVSWRELLINERDEARWKQDHYRHVFAAIVSAATHGVTTSMQIMLPADDARSACKYIPGLTAGGLIGHNGGPEPDWLVPPCPALAGFRDQDLRDTAVTWLALAGCTLPEIAAVTGHSPETITSIMKHYLARHPELADHAVTKLENWHG